MNELTNPVSLFNSLNLKPEGQITNLWDCQIETLNLYYEKMLQKKRVAIELPTGSGKSIIALTLLEMWRNAGKRVAILVSSIELGNDMAKRCEDLGLPCAVITGKRNDPKLNRARYRNIRKYQRNKAIGILNYWAYIRGKDIATPEILIIDDADNFSNLLYDNYSLIIKKEEDSDIYYQLINNLKTKPIYQRLEQFETHSKIRHSQLIYFPHTLEIIKILQKIIHSKPRKEISKDLYWSYERNGDRLQTYLLLVTAEEIIFTPHVIPGNFEKLRDIEQIIFMSATLGSPEMMHKSLGSLEKMEMITENDLTTPIGTMGKRIIFPLPSESTTWQSFHELFPKIIKILETFHKAIILCNSFTESYRLKNYLTSLQYGAWIYGKELSGHQFSLKEKGALIIAGRLIGIDFPDETCRVEIITKMPYYIDAHDIIANDILDDTQYRIEKTSYRLVQALGRCNRSPNDYAVYFIMDGRLAEDAWGDEQYVQYFPTRMKGELDFGLEYAMEGGLESAIAISEKLLSNNFDEFEDEILERLRFVKKYPIKFSESAYLLEIKAWYDLSERRSYLDAAETFEMCLSKLTDVQNESTIRKKAWLSYLIAMSYHLAYIYFQNESYKEKCLEMLNQAKTYGETSWFSGLQLLINELKENGAIDEVLLFDLNTQTSKEHIIRNWQQFLRENTSKKRTPMESWGRLRLKLTKGSHNEICDALEQALEVMGFEVRAMRRVDAEPDLLAFSNVGDNQYLCIIEVKSEKQEGSQIKTKDIDQISGNRQKYEREYSNYEVYPVLFTNKNEIDPLAEEKAIQNVRILRSAEFTAFMTSYFDLIEKSKEVKTQAHKFALMQKIPTPDQYERLFSPSNTPIVILEEFLSLL